MLVGNQFYQYNELDGSPLEAGFVYFGVVNQNPETNPVAVFWDDAYTIPALQPVRTTNGFFYRNGAIANLYSQTAFSVTVKNKNSVLCYSLPDSTKFDSGASLRSDLAALNGAGLVNFSHASTYAPGTIGAKEKQYVSVKDAPFNAIGNGVVDDTAAIQLAINAVGAAGGGCILFPSGTYRVSSEITISYPNVRLSGDSRFSTLIIQATNAARILNVSGDFFELDRLSLTYSGTPIAGADAIKCVSSYCSFENFIIRKSWIGINYSFGVAGKITNFEILDYGNIGISISSLNDLFISKFIMNAGAQTRGLLGGIRLQEKAEAIIVTDGDILLGQFSMTMDASINAMNVRPAYNSFTNVYFDSADKQVILNATVETDFVNCWFSGGRKTDAGNITGIDFPGIELGTTDSIRFTNTRFFNCGLHGCVVDATAKRTTFTACVFESNSVSAGAGVGHGLRINDGTTDFQVIGCTAHNGLYSGSQGYGILVGTGSSDFALIGNNVKGNLTGGILDGTPGITSKTVNGNIGYNTSSSGVVSIPSGTTSIAVPHNLSITPLLSEILVTRGSTNATNVDCFPISVTSTTFTLNLTPAPTSTILINWQVKTAGA